jgi:DNA-binding MarR family transcriptional regulator
MGDLAKSGKAKTARRLTYAVKDLMLAYKSAIEDSVREYGLTLPQLRMLHAVSEQHEVSAAAIARQCHVTPQTLQAMLTRAVREGWIVRGMSASNQRILTASLTERGRELRELGQQAAARIETQMWENVSRKELEHVIELLETGAAALGRPQGGTPPPHLLPGVK